MVPCAARGAGLGDRPLGEQGVDGEIPLSVAEAGGREDLGLAGPTHSSGDGLLDGVQHDRIRGGGTRCRSGAWADGCATAGEWPEPCSAASTR